MSTLGQSPTPPGVARFDWHSCAMGGIAAAWLVVEADGFRINAQQRREVALGLRSHPDYKHRTWTELTRWLGASDRDGENAPFGRLRRALLIGGLSVLTVHFLTDGRYFQGV
jgi:hypothetical protein